MKPQAHGRGGGKAHVGVVKKGRDFGPFEGVRIGEIQAGEELRGEGRLPGWAWVPGK